MLESAPVKRGLAIVLGVAALGIWGLFLLVAGPDEAFRPAPADEDAPGEDLDEDEEPDAPEPSPHEPTPTLPPADPPGEPQPSPEDDPPAQVAPEPEPGAEGEAELEPPGRGGPVDELSRAYQSSSADSGAAAAEALIRELFGTEELPRELMRSVSCHRTVCKIQMVWSREHPFGVMALGMLLGHRMNPVLAIDPAGELDRQGDLPMDIYALREGYEVEDL